jgi:hypothetical protein
MIRIVRPNNFTPEKSLLTFIEITHISDRAFAFHKAKYLCKCGNYIEANINNVKTGKTTSCGCMWHIGTPTHGQSEHPLYAVWENMLSRCYNKKVKSYNNYGGRGVTMCPEWKNDPGAFIRWGLSNGWKKGLQLDKDIKGGLLYSPETCIFITVKENCNNRRTSRYITYNGETKTLIQWCETFNVQAPTLHGRIAKHGVEKAFKLSIKNNE